VAVRLLHHALMGLGLLAGLLAPALAEPFAFKGVTLGDPYARDPRFQCHAMNTPLGDSLCSLNAHERETIAGQPVRSYFRYYHQGRLSAMVLHFDAAGFEAVTTALTAKYGPPQTAEASLKNLKGETFQNRRAHWLVDGMSMEGLRYSGRLDQSSLRLIDLGAQARMGSERKQRRQGAPVSDH